MFLCYLAPWPPVDIYRKFYGDCPGEELNARGLAKYNDFGPIEVYISETVQYMR